MALSPRLLEAIHKAMDPGRALDEADEAGVPPAEALFGASVWTSSDPSCRTRREENDRLLEVLPRRLIEEESLRAPHRWAGYQFMSPLDCTRQFAADYRAQFKRTFYGDCHFEPEVGSEEFEILWEMRQAADSCMMSYPLYMEIAFHIVRRRDVELFRRPHMRFAKFQEKKTWNKLVVKAHAEGARGRQRSQVAAMGHFQSQSFRGLPAQQRFRDSIRTVAETYGYRWAAQMYVLQSPVLSPAELVSNLSGTKRVEAIAEMQAADRTFIQVAEEVAPEKLLQTCFAWPRRKAWEDRCKVCPQEAACGDPFSEAVVHSGAIG